MIVGDSIGLELAAAIRDDGPAQTHYLQSVGARWLKNAEQHDALRGAIATINPDLVVVAIGFWDVSAPFGHPESVTPESAASISTATYSQQLADFRSTIRDVPIVWLLPPQTNWTHLNDGLSRLEAQIKIVACGRGDKIVDPRSVLGNEWAGESRIGGEMVRARHADGIHYCPAGISAVAAHLLGEIGMLAERVVVPEPGTERFVNC